MSKHYLKPNCFDVSWKISDFLDFRNASTFRISKIGNLVQIFKILKLQSNFKDMGRHSTQFISAFTIVLLSWVLKDFEERLALKEIIWKTEMESLVPVAPDFSEVKRAIMDYICHLR